MRNALMTSQQEMVVAIKLIAKDARIHWAVDQ
jgi:hypothetical protein